MPTTSSPARPWRRDDLAPGSWSEPTPDSLLDALDELIHTPPEELTSARLPEAVRGLARSALRPAAEALEQGPGFVILEPPSRDLGDRQRTLLYWLIGQALGTPVVQNVQGTLLYDVRDTGQDVRYGARFSVTSAESSFHTDASFFDDLVDYVGLLCLRPARAGGLSQLVDGRAAYGELSRRRPEALAILSQPFHVDRRGGARPGEAPTARFPILSGDGDRLTYRYLRYWIEAGQEKAGAPLSAEQTAALDALDEVLSSPELRVEFFMRRGETLFVNNRRLLHNRTAFDDFDEPERRRHLVRLWLARR
jgi:alpha-ketoglutarate-dependent taurine dioxygenase